MIEQIKSIERHAVLTALSKVCLQFGKIGPPVMDDDHLPVKDSLALDSEGTRDTGEAFCPVVAVAGEDLDHAAVKMRLDPVAIVFDLVKPLVALRRLGL